LGLYPDWIFGFGSSANVAGIGIARWVVVSLVRGGHQTAGMFSPEELPGNFENASQLTDELAFVMRADSLRKMLRRVASNARRCV